MRNFSNEFKETMVTKLLSPGGPSANQLSKEVGITQTSLSRWVRECKERTGYRNEKRPQDWDSKEKWKVLMETANMAEADLGRYIREKGLHGVHLQQWKNEVLESMDKSSKRKPTEYSLLKKENKKLKQELRRKDKALAEASALLILKKKAELIWGTIEDDEQE